MENSCLLIVAMAEQCRGLILESDTRDLGLPKELQTKHLLWMCNKIQQHAEEWTATKLHRWIGFVQCALMAHRMLDLDEAREMFDKAKAAHGETGEDLLDHLDPMSPFVCDVGGES
jgi:hypothetical protein